MTMVAVDREGRNSGGSTRVVYAMSFNECTSQHRWIAKETATRSGRSILWIKSTLKKGGRPDRSLFATVPVLSLASMIAHDEPRQRRWTDEGSRWITGDRQKHLDNNELCKSLIFCTTGRASDDLGRGHGSVPVSEISLQARIGIRESLRKRDERTCDTEKAISQPGQGL